VDELHEKRGKVAENADRKKRRTLKIGGIERTPLVAQRRSSSRLNIYAGKGGKEDCAGTRRNLGRQRLGQRGGRHSDEIFVVRKEQGSRGAGGQLRRPGPRREEKKVPQWDHGLNSRGARL